MRRAILILMLLVTSVGAEERLLPLEVYPSTADVYVEKPGSKEGRTFVGPANEELYLSDAVHFSRGKAKVLISAPGRTTEELELFWHELEKPEKAWEVELPAESAALRLVDFFRLYGLFAGLIFAVALISAGFWWQRSSEVQRRRRIEALGGNLNEPFHGYILLDRLGAGGMAEVFRAVPEDDLRPEKVRALKRILPDKDDPEFRRRFQREIKNISKMNHPGIVRVYDYGGQDNDLYIVMEVLEGEEMVEYCDRQAPLHSDEFLRLAKELSEALHHAHGQGIVHRDLTNRNIMVTDQGKAKILDFGLARKPIESQQITLDAGCGTPLYAPQEQWEGNPTPQSDQFSLAVVFFYMLTGEFPFELTDPVAANPLGYLWSERRSIVKMRPELNPELDEVFKRALSPEPQNRFAHIKDFYRALEAKMHSVTPVTVGAN